MKRLIGFVLVLALLSCSALAEDKRPTELLQEYAELLVGEWIDYDEKRYVVIDKNDLYISANGVLYLKIDYYGLDEVLFSVDNYRIIFGRTVFYRMNDVLRDFLYNNDSFMASGKWVYVDTENETIYTMIFDEETMTLSDGNKTAEFEWYSEYGTSIRFYENGDGFSCDIEFFDGNLQIEWDDDVYFVFEK